MGRKVEIELAVDASKVDKGFRQASASAKRFRSSLNDASAGAATSGKGTLGMAAAFSRVPGPAAAAAVAIGLSAKASVDAVAAASSLNEQISKSRAVFGSSSASIERWSKSTAGNMGIARTAALEATGTFGNLFSTVGIQAGEASKMSQVLVGLASDLASFNDVDPSEVLEALRSGLIGEAEPMRRFGVLLSETRVQARALADTGKKNASALTQQEKAISRYSIILGDTKKAQGDFARTSGTLANQQRELKARLADTQAELGTRLLPVMVKATEAANNLVKSFHGVEASASDLNSVDFRKVFIDAFGIEELKRVIDGLGPELKALSEQFRKDVQGVPLTAVKEAAVKIPSFGDPGFKTGTGPRVKLGPSVDQRNTIFDSSLARSLDRAQDGSLQKQLASLKKISQTITARIAATKDITRKLNLEDQLVSLQRQSRSIGDQISGDALAAREEQRAKSLAAAARAAAAVQSKQFRAIGLAGDGGDVVPGVANLKKQLESLTARLGPTVSTKLKGQLGGVRKVLSGEFGAITRDSRKGVAGIFDAIRGEFDKGAKGPLTKGSGLDTKKVVAGLGLSASQINEIRGRISGANSSGLALAGGGTGDGLVGGRGTIVESHVTVQLDGHTVGKTVTRSQQRTKKRNPAQRRGPNRGGV